MADGRRTFLPAAGHDRLLPLYDPLVALLGGHRTRSILVEQAALRPGHQVLEIGCGTGGLMMAIRQRHPDVRVIGLDPDPRALARAKRKAARSGAAFRLDQASSDNLPYRPGTFDRVFSSFMFHHLAHDQREPTLAEARRVLKAGGALHMLDFAGGRGDGVGALSRLLHSSHRLEDNAEDRILALMHAAGFATPEALMQGTMFFGQIRVVYYRAVTPAATGE